MVPIDTRTETLRSTYLQPFVEMLGQVIHANNHASVPRRLLRPFRTHQQGRPAIIRIFVRRVADAARVETRDGSSAARRAAFLSYAMNNKLSDKREAWLALLSCPHESGAARCRSTHYVVKQVLPTLRPLQHLTKRCQEPVAPAASAWSFRRRRREQRWTGPPAPWSTHSPCTSRRCPLSETHVG